MDNQNEAKVVLPIVKYGDEYTFLWFCTSCGSRTLHVMRGAVRVCVPCALSKVVGGPTS